MTTTQWAWEALGLGAHPPPVPRRGPQYGPDPDCWLCGGPTNGIGWPRATALPPTYTNYNVARRPASTSVCQPCVGFGSKEVWEAFVARHPEKGLKTGHAMSWRCYSHVIAAGLHDSPTRARWRDWLLDPPDPPFLFVAAVSGQKHILFRAQIARARDLYPVQFEEETLYIERQRFTACLEAFERLYALGFSKDSVRDGQYHHGQMLKVGLAAWRDAESAFASWRRWPSLVALAHFVAQRPEDAPMWEPDAEARAELVSEHAESVSVGQGRLF